MPLSPPAPRSWTGPARTSSGWNAASGHATTRPRTRSAPASRSSLPAGGSAPACEQRRAPVPAPASPPSPGHSTSRRSTPRPPPTAGTPCSPACPPTPPASWSLCKGQEAVERRYSAFKGPLAVAALFLKNNRRIAALVTVICLALLIFCLIERQVRQALAEQGKTKLEGLYAGRPAIPTGRLILQTLARMKIIPTRGQDPPIIPQPTPIQLQILDLLGIDPRQLR